MTRERIARVDRTIPLISYRGYMGSVEFDADECIFHGKLAFIRGLVSYEAEDAEGLIQAFHEAVDDYLTHRAGRGAAPPLD